MMPILFGAPRLKITANTNIIIDGNSIYAVGEGLDSSIQAQLGLVAPFLDSGASFSTVAIGGQTWADMVTSDADVDAAFVEGNDNILIVGECTNTAYFTAGTGAEMWASAIQYMTDRKAAHPTLKIVLCGSIPYLSGTFPAEVLGGNQRMIDFDALALAGWREYADAFVNFRTLSNPEFNHAGVQLTFELYGTSWFDTYMHPSALGFGQMASTIANIIKRMPR